MTASIFRRSSSYQVAQAFSKAAICKALPLLSIALAVAACSTPRPGAPNGKTYPLSSCDAQTHEHCVANLFANNEAIKERGKKDFPQDYLELWDESKVLAFCQQNFTTALQACVDRLTEVSAYLNPNGRPTEQEWAVALEGGGSKAAPFSLGVLGGLSELNLLHDGAQGPRITAISSISGGSYAASYYYNRLYDLHMRKADAGSEREWFNSCVPSHFARDFKLIAGDKFPLCNENEDRAKQCLNEFDEEYRFLGHVWVNHDLLRGDAPGNLATQESWRLAEWTNIGLLSAETAVTIPFQFVARTAFRWPMNSAPSKLAYKLGLEREYGYSPQDWKDSGCSQLAHMTNTLLDRRKDRTISKLSELTSSSPSVEAIEPAPPRWIIGSTAPGRITGAEWTTAAERDPIRQQFEITALGYGSGVYGYARQAPDAPFDFLGRNPTGLPILDAVVASAAFFDDDQTLISDPAVRLPAGAFQHFANVTWFTEIPNFNSPDGQRDLERVAPWPLYLLDTQRYGESAHIHLQDGGNAENSGIFPLLRRGYRKIFYAHGTQDTQAEFASICHLKNQLELDGSYIVVSPELENKIGQRGKGSAGRFKTYLDGLCATQLDRSDLVVFDQNPQRPPDKRDLAVAKLYCARLGYAVGDSFVPCDEYREKFGPQDSNLLPPSPGAGAPTCKWRDGKATTLAKSLRPKELGFVADQDLFYDWHTDTVVHFVVYRFDPFRCGDPGDPPPGEADFTSSIVAIVPGISFTEVKGQLDAVSASDWNDFCGRSATQASLQIKSCSGPKGEPWPRSAKSSDALEGQDLPGLSCTALAHVIEDKCGGSKNDRHPNFPQDDFVLQTVHETYTTYGAYYDLGRHLLRRAVFCETHPDKSKNPAGQLAGDK